MLFAKYSLTFHQNLLFVVGMFQPTCHNVYEDLRHCYCLEKGAKKELCHKINIYTYTIEKGRIETNKLGKIKLSFL